MPPSVVIDSPHLVPFEGQFELASAPTGPPQLASKKELKKALKTEVNNLRDLQRVLYADNRYAALFVFQAMDAAGKDGTIRAVFTGVNPAGLQVFSFKRPSTEELDHDFLWRVGQRLPERGRIGVFNRSHYEEVLVVKVHPQILEGQRLPTLDREAVWQQRYASIRNFEEHLAINGTVVVKFFLNVSKDEQRRRFIKRIDEPEANWKFEAGDIRERQRWDDYQSAYNEALVETSRPWAPWYCIPADDKPWMRLQVASIAAQTLASLDLSYPNVSEEKKAELLTYRALLQD